ncbi:universal stress protein [Pseudonocardia nigra]|uniref:universal stress protein n=1 Tax=Pseudonocardia nigra TaxID=1921578 RepID=UPI001C5E1FD1|nr:universal stress protein [Pseudonocardia nigra]
MTSPNDREPTVEPTLVVGYGRDPSSDHALLVATDFARRLGARLHVVHTVCLADYPVDPDAWDWEEQGAAGLAEQRRSVARLLGDTDVAWSYEDRRGDPACELARAAAEHDALLIVVGTRGEGLRRALARLVDPSVSHGVIQRQRRPVLVVPAHPRSESER